MDTIKLLDRPIVQCYVCVTSIENTWQYTNLNFKDFCKKKLQLKLKSTDFTWPQILVDTHPAPIQILMRPHQCPESQTEAGPQMRLSVSPLSWVIVIKWGRHVLLCRPLGSDESWYSWNNTAPTTIELARHLVGLSKVVLSLKC